MELPIANQLSVIDQELVMWRNTRYLYEIRHRINKKLGNVEEAKACVTELEKCERWIAELSAVRAELAGEPTDEHSNGKLLDDGEIEQALRGKGKR